MFCSDWVPLEFLSLRLVHTELLAISQLQFNLPSEVSASGFLLQEIVILCLSNLGGSGLSCGLTSLMNLTGVDVFTSSIFYLLG